MIKHNTSKSDLSSVGLVLSTAGEVAATGADIFRRGGAEQDFETCSELYILDFDACAVKQTLLDMANSSKEFKEIHINEFVIHPFFRSRNMAANDDDYVGNIQIYIDKCHLAGHRDGASVAKTCFHFLI